MSKQKQYRLRTEPGRLAKLPISLFGSLIGLTGLALAWQIAHAIYGVSHWIVFLIGVLAALAFVAQTTCYLVKVFTCFDSVVEEFHNPTTSNLFGTPLIVLLQLPLLVSEVSVPLARVVWSIGTILMLFFSFNMFTRWIDVKREGMQATPAWIVPVVGLIIIPLAVPALGWQQVMREVDVFAFTVGFFMLIPVFTIIMSRLMFEERYPDELQPSLLILVAPFAVGFTSYVGIVGKMDLFSEALYMVMLFVLLALIFRVRYLIKCCPFRISWWAVAFPLASSASAGLRYAEHVQSATATAVAFVLLGIATLTIFALLIRTLVGMARGDLQKIEIDAQAIIK